MKKIIRFLPSIIWMAFIFYLSSRQTTGIGGNSYWWRFIILKFFHIIEYGVLAIVLFIATSKYNYSLFIGVLYAISDEFHQSIVPGRTATLRDIFFDISGIFLGFLIISLLLKITKVNKFLVQKKE
jgi:VanZ family protein